MIQGHPMAQIATTRTDKAADGARAAAFEMLKAGGAVAGFWLQQGNSQLVHHARTLRNLAAARDWRKRRRSNSFLHDSLARLNQGVSHYVHVTAAMAARLREARSGGAAATASNGGQQR
jgi:hypothetical protein